MNEIKPKKAKEMFDELGYELMFTTRASMWFELKDDCETFIYFDLQDKSFSAERHHYPKNIKANELKAIYQQMHELGWL